MGVSGLGHPSLSLQAKTVCLHIPDGWAELVVLEAATEYLFLMGPLVVSRRPPWAEPSPLLATCPVHVCVCTGADVCTHGYVSVYMSYVCAGVYACVRLSMRWHLEIVA